MTINQLIKNEAVRKLIINKLREEMDAVYNNQNLRENEKEQVMEVLKNLESKINYETRLTTVECENVIRCIQSSLKKAKTVEDRKSLGYLLDLAIVKKQTTLGE